MKKVLVACMVFAGFFISAMGQSGIYHTELSSDLILGFDDKGNAIYETSTIGNGSLYPSRTLEDRITGPSPEVSGMMKYVDASMNYSDGTATLSVPLFKWHEGSIEMDIALNYQIRGYRHNEKSGWFGMGWTLSAAGAVSRSIMNLPDEFRGYDSRSLSTLLYSTDLKDATRYLKAIETMAVDAHLDRYSYYCPGGSGSFVILDNDIVQLPASENEISLTLKKDNQGKEYIDSFTVTTPDGTRYIFSEKENCHHKYQSMSLMNYPYRYEYDAIITWHLSQIISPEYDLISYDYDVMPSWQLNRNTKLRVLNYTIVQNDFRVSGGGPNGANNTNLTTYSDTRILKSIRSLAGAVVFKHETSKFDYGDEPSMRVSEIIFRGPDVNNVANVKLKGVIGTHGKLTSIHKYVGDELADKWQFNYYGGSNTSYDFFGYCNGKNTNGGYHAVIDTETGKFNAGREYNLGYARTGSLSSWITFSGVRTDVNYEVASPKPADSVDYNRLHIDLGSSGRNTEISDEFIREMDPLGFSIETIGGKKKEDDGPDPTNPRIGIRIKSFRTTDPVTNKSKIRSFEYSDGICNVNLAGIRASDFISLSGNHDCVRASTDNGSTALVDRYCTSATMLNSTRGCGYAPENAKVFYGRVVESIHDSRDSVPEYVNEYIYDTSICHIPVDQYNGGIRNIKALHEQKRYLYNYSECDKPTMPLGINPSYMKIFQNADIVSGSFRETIGAQPLLKRVVRYRRDSSGLKPQGCTLYNYELCDSIRIPVGTFHEGVVRRDGVFAAIPYRYHNLDEFSLFQYHLLAFRPLLRSKSEFTYFDDGSSRNTSTCFYYTSDSTAKSMYRQDAFWSLAFNSAGYFKALPTDNTPLKPFNADTLGNITSQRLPLGVFQITGGEVIERYTAIAAYAKEGFFAQAAADGRLTVPIATMWIVNGADTLLQKHEYTRTGKKLWPSRISLVGHGRALMAEQIFNCGFTHGLPCGMKQTGMPQKHYSWDSFNQLTEITLGDKDSGLKTSYGYDNYVGCTEITRPSGRKEYFDYCAGRLSARYDSDRRLLARHNYEYIRDNSSGNFPYNINTIRSTTYSSERDSVVTSRHYDGFGNMIIGVTEGLGNGEDILNVQHFDALGRMLKQWRPLLMSDDMKTYGINHLPDELFREQSCRQYGEPLGYDSVAYDGNTVQIRRAGEQFFKHPSKTEALCSNPAIKELDVQRYIMFQGKLSHGLRYLSGNGETSAYALNYSAGELDCTKSTDADGRVTLVFTDCLGRTVLTRAIADDGSFADTYVISNSWGDPLVVIPPAYAANLARSFDSYKTKINSMAYVYTYDDRHRLRSKKFPGLQEVEFVYDSEGRLAFSRDGNQRAAGVCSFRLYDAYGREALTGTCADRNPAIWNGSYIAPEMTVTGLTRKDATGTVCRSGYSVAGAVSALIPSAKLLTASYYDDYSAVPANLPSGAISQPRGLCTATLMATLGGDSPQQLLTVNYYDCEERLIKSVVGNLLQGDYTVESSYSPYGLLTAQRDAFTLNRNIGTEWSHSHSYSYDRFGRTLDVMLDFSGRSIRTLGCEYDNLGRLSRTWGYNDDLSCSIAYNINGTATHRSTPFVTEDLWFGYGKVPQYSGKISGKDIYYGGNKQSYSYRYDKLGRLTEAGYSERENPEADYSASYSYDLEANPTRIKRMGLTDVGTYGVVNEIRADYRNGRPRSVVDAADAPILEGSLIGPGLQVKVTHEYDANGNLIKDATRGIDSIRYNVLNLPERIYFSNGYRLDYIYRADGVKLRETRRRPTFIAIGGLGGVITETTDYIGAYELEGGIPRRLNLPGGYMTIADTVYHHYIPDYQGNILSVVNTRTRQVEQRTDYYPYGMQSAIAAILRCRCRIRCRWCRCKERRYRC